MPGIVVVVSTADRPETLSFALTGLLVQTVVDKIVIYDNGEVPACRSYPVWNLMDYLGNVDYIRRPWKGMRKIPLMRKKALELGMEYSKYVFLLDDDAFLYPEFVSKVRETLIKRKCASVEGVNKMASNVFGLPGYTNRELNSFPVEETAWRMNFYNFDMEVETSFSDVCCTLFDMSKVGKNLDKLIDWDVKPVMGYPLTYGLPCYLRTGARSLKINNSDGTEWRNLKGAFWRSVEETL